MGTVVRADAMRWSVDALAIWAHAMTLTKTKPKPQLAQGNCVRDAEIHGHRKLNMQRH